MVGPWLFSLWKRGGRLSDIEYLSIKDFDGKLRQNDGTQSATGDVATLTANSGKDMYLASAHFNVISNTVNMVITATVVLKINGVIVDTWKTSGVSPVTLQARFGEYIFPVGFKVTTGQIIKIECTANGGNDADIIGEIQCFEEATGASPAI